MSEGPREADDGYREVVYYPLWLITVIFLGFALSATCYFGFLSIAEKRIPLELIAGAEPISYHPMRQFGAWGVRMGVHDGSKTAVYSIGGSLGVLLTLKVPINTLFARTDKVLIGNRSPQRLAETLDAARS